MELNSKFVRLYCMLMINRELSVEFQRLVASFPVVTVTGPRQSGKTTLCKMCFPNYYYVTLEDLLIRDMIASDPNAFLYARKEGLIIDEVQQLPSLFSYIQVLVDKDPKCKIILTGSSNFSLIERISQSLAGRTAIITLLPLSLTEISSETISTDTYMIKGGYPAVWGKGQDARDVYSNYYATYVERDLRQLINVRNLASFQQFIRLSAGRTSCEFVASDFANELGVDVKTIQHWNSILEASYITFLLPPYYRNFGKRIVKTAKRYFYDTGLLCFLIGIENEQQLSVHPLRGAIFENMVVVEMMKHYYNAGKRPNLFYYRDKSQNEVDVIDEILFDKLYLYEIKSSQSYNAFFAKGLDYLRKIYGEMIVGSSVIYDGKETLDATYNGYENYRNIKYFAKTDLNNL